MVGRAGTLLREYVACSAVAVHQGRRRYGRWSRALTDDSYKRLY